MSAPGRPVVAVIRLTPLGPYPVSLMCPHCRISVITSTYPSPGILTYLLCGGLLIFPACWFGCCLLPFCFPGCQDVEHICPNCEVLLGVYRRL